MTNDDKETIKNEIKEIIKLYDENIEDDALNNLVEELVTIDNVNNTNKIVKFVSEKDDLKRVKELINKYKKCN